MSASGLLSDTGAARPPIARVVGPAVAAMLVVAGGGRLELTGARAVDAVLTLAWVLAMTGAGRRLDGRAPTGVVLVGVTAVLGLAAAGTPYVWAAVALGLAGSVVALIAFRGAVSPLVGQGGRLLLGFLVSVAVVPAQPALGPAARVLLPLLLLTVALTGRAGGLGTGPEGGSVPAPSSTAVLLGVQVLAGVGVALADQGMLPLPLGTAITVAVVGGLGAALRPVRAWRRAVERNPRLGWAVAAAVVAPVALAIPAVVAMAAAAGPAQAGVRAAERALGAARRGEAQQAVADFSRAQAAFRRADRRLSGPLPALGLAVPVVSSNLRAAGTLAEGGAQLSRAGGRLAAKADPERLRFQGGAVPLDEVRRIQPDLEAVADDMRRTRSRVDDIGRTFLLPPVRSATDEAASRLQALARDTEVAAEAARLVPAIFGGDGPRRYFLAVQNNAEARATGGLIGDYGELVAEDGRLRLDRFGPIDQLNKGGSGQRVLHASEDYVDRYARFAPESTWQNVNFSPDFPTVAKVIADLYPQSGGQPVDGVIAVDPQGLASLLRLTGPVRVADWPERISGTNVVDVTLRQAYERFADRDVRRGFLGEVASQVVRDISTSDLGDPGRITNALGPSVRQRHLQVHLTRPDEQRLVERLGAGGHMPVAGSDSLMAVNQNAAANKVDYYLRRRLRYRVQLDPRDGAADVRAGLDVVLDNTAPSAGLPPYVLGPSDSRFTPGENYTYLSLYTPLEFGGARLEGRPVEMEEATELGRYVYSSFLSVPAGSTRTLSLALVGSVPLEDGWYTLDLVRQALLAPDQVDVAVEVPAGWRVAEAVGLTPGDRRRAEGHLAHDADTTLRVRLERTR